MASSPVNQRKATAVWAWPSRLSRPGRRWGPGGKDPVFGGLPMAFFSAVRQLSCLGLATNGAKLLPLTAAYPDDRSSRAGQPALHLPDSRYS